MPRTPPVPREPGVTASDPDAAIAAGQRGGTHKVQKHPDPETLPKSDVQGDPDAGPDAPVNAQKEMSYDEAMKLLSAGKLKRSVLTERGWVVAPKQAGG